MDLERPNDPISFIALYLLKNREKVRMPQLPADYFMEKMDENQEGFEETDKVEKVEEEKKEATGGKKIADKEKDKKIKK